MPEKTLNALADHGNGAPSIEGTSKSPTPSSTSWLSSASTSSVTDKLEADIGLHQVAVLLPVGIDRVNDRFDAV